MILLWNNLAAYDGVVITSSSEYSADLGPGNVVDPRRSKAWRTGIASAAEWIKFDLGSAKAVQVQGLILLDHTLISGDSAIYLQGSASDSWGSPYSVALTYHAGKMYVLLDTPRTYQWWRIIFTKSSSSEYRDIGKVFLGMYDEMELSAAQPDGLEIKPVDLSNTDRALGGQTYSDIKDQYDEITIEFPEAVSEAQTALLLSLAAACGTHTPFFISVDPADKPYDWLWYVKAKGLTGYKVRLKKGAMILWDATLKLAEEV